MLESCSGKGGRNKFPVCELIARNSGSVYTSSMSGCPDSTPADFCPRTLLFDMAVTGDASDGVIS